MSLNGPRLNGTITAAVYSQLQSQYASVLTGLNPTQIAGIQLAWQRMANSVGAAGNPIVSEIDTNAVVNITGVMAGGGTATGTVT